MRISMTDIITAIIIRKSINPFNKYAPDIMNNAAITRVIAVFVKNFFLALSIFSVEIFDRILYISSKFFMCFRIVNYIEISIYLID